MGILKEMYFETGCIIMCMCKLPYMCVCVAEEDEFDSYSHVLLQFFLAEGVISGHKLFIASAQDHPDDIIKVITHCDVQTHCAEGILGTVGFPGRKLTF